jgi:Metallo-beta-lactamase superfamily
MNRWKIGDVTITRIVLMETTSKATFVLKDGSPENICTVPRLRPHFRQPGWQSDHERARLCHRIAGASDGRRHLHRQRQRRAFPGWNMLQLPFLADLEQAGFARDSIDPVLCTHLHVDHVGWNTMLVDGKWTPSFRARAT